MGIDVPVSSWRICLGVLGEKNKHIILAQNNFRYADCVYDIDYTAIPVAWAVDIVLTIKNHLPTENARHLPNSFLSGGKRTFSRRIEQQRTREP